ncbi:MAG TPA: TIGR00730 family Rossman fold protein, partial [Candidatus Baltobacteraceae bacterium]
MSARLCVFCGSQNGGNERYVRLASDVAQRLVARGYDLVYGGGRVGLMGTMADAALAAGGAVIGVIPKSLATRELAHGGLSELHVVDSMHERKALMADLSDGFIALPGGF